MNWLHKLIEMVTTQKLLQLSNANPLVSGEFGYNPVIPNQYELSETEEVGDVPMSETYSGLDVGFYDSPSGLTITPNTEITSFGTGPSIFAPSGQYNPPREVTWWDYVIVGALMGPMRILNFPWTLIEGAKLLTDYDPDTAEGLPQ